MRQRRRELLENLGGLFNPVRWTNKTWLNKTSGGSKWERWSQILGRSQNLEGNAKWEKLRNDFKWGMTLSPSQVAEYSRTFGIPKAIGLVTKEWVYSAIVFAGVSALTDLLTDVIGMALIKLKYPKDWYFYNSVLNNAISYDLHIGGIRKNLSKDESYIQKALDIALPVFSYWLDELKTVSAYIPGGWDDILRLGVDFLHSFMYLNVDGENITKEQLERLQKQGSELFPLIENAIDKVTAEFNKEMSEFEKMTDNNRNTPAGFTKWIKLHNLENKLPGHERKEDLKIFGSEVKQSDWWTEKENSKDGVPFGTTSDGRNWAFSLVQTPHTFVECSDCAKKEEPAPPTPTDSTTITTPTDTTTTTEPVTSTEITVDEIVSAKPCLTQGGWKVEKIISNKNPKGIWVSGTNQDIALNVQKISGKLKITYASDGTEVMCQ